MCIAIICVVSLLHDSNGIGELWFLVLTSTFCVFLDMHTGYPKFLRHLQAAAFAFGKTKNPNVKAGSLIPRDADCCTGTNCGNV